MKQSSILPRTEMEPPKRFSDLHYCFDPWNGSQGASRLTYGLGLTRGSGFFVSLFEREAPASIGNTPHVTPHL